jgi:hypothetical protein
MQVFYENRWSTDSIRWLTGCDMQSVGGRQTQAQPGFTSIWRLFIAWPAGFCSVRREKPTRSARVRSP